MIVLDAAAWTWADGQTVGPVDWAPTGRRILLTGASGSGKSTLLRLACGILARHATGTATGRVRLGDDDPARLPPAQRARRIGFVPQDPADQVVAGTVRDEVAFGLHTTSWPANDRARRVDEVLERLDLVALAERDPRTLSGGQLQRVAIAAAIAPAPDVLLLDEPLAWLDADAARRVLALLATLDALVIVAEHRVAACWAWADGLAVVAEGRLAHAGRPEVSALPAGIERPASTVSLEGGPRPSPPRPTGRAVLEARDLRHAYGAIVAVDGVDLVLHAGERVALVGPNGAGKSTLLKLLAPRPGALAIPQDPDLALFAPTVADELAYGPREHGRTPDLAPLLDALGLAGLADRPPHSLSRGQRLRVAVGAGWACAPDVLLLDEPTAGQDRGAVDAMFDGLETFAGAVLFATHDLALALRRSDRIVALDAGRVVFDGPPGAWLAAPTLPVPPLAARAHAADVDLAWADAKARA